MRTWYIATPDGKVEYTSWRKALDDWKKTITGYLCRSSGTCLDCK